MQSTSWLLLSPLLGRKPAGPEWHPKQTVTQDVSAVWCCCWFLLVKSLYFMFISDIPCARGNSLYCVTATSSRTQGQSETNASDSAVNPFSFSPCVQHKCCWATKGALGSSPNSSCPSVPSKEASKKSGYVSCHTQQEGSNCTAG